MRVKKFYISKLYPLPIVIALQILTWARLPKNGIRYGEKAEEVRNSGKITILFKFHKRRFADMTILLNRVE